MLTNIGCLYRIQGDFAKAQIRFQEALQVYRQQGRNVWETDVQCAMTENAIVQGDFSSARLHLQAAESLLGSSENKMLQVLVGYFRGVLSYYEGNLEAAAARLSETVSMARKGQFLPDLARSLLTLGLVRLRQGDIPQATKLLHESLGTYQEIGLRLGFAIAFEALAMASLAQAEQEQALRLLSTANALRKSLGAPVPPVDQPVYDSAINSLRERFGEAKFTALWGQAATRPCEELVEEVMRARMN
ncbi:MAG TPA: tetratricopeptide repeat protein [Anaerolineales bacterium]